MSTILFSWQVAVIGDGPAGLVAARELRREGHKVVVFERGNQIGGTWVYNSMVESDPLGVDPNRSIVQSSLYKSMRTNLPREVMGFKGYPLAPENDGNRVPRRYPGQEEVLLYLQDFANEFEIEEMVRFDTEVVHVGLVEDCNKWKVMFKKKRVDDFGSEFEEEEELYDAVVVCCGHFTEPHVADVPGITCWPGKQMHSHNYRVPEPFKDQVVIIIGSSFSAADLSIEIAGVAKEVHVASRSVPDDTCEKQPGYHNLWLHSMIESSHEDGTLAFRDGSVVLADIILHCTGYKFHIPFLKTNGIVTVGDDLVRPLYKHVFPPALAPWLSLVGMTRKIIPFPMFEYQSKWIAGVLSGKISLPSQDQMTEDFDAFYSTLQACDVPKRYPHNSFSYQVDYANWLAGECQCPGLENWRVKMYYKHCQHKAIWPNAYRDEWEDDELIFEAQQSFNRAAPASPS